MFVQIFVCTMYTRWFLYLLLVTNGFIWCQGSYVSGQNSHIPNTPWPIYHANSAAQASTSFEGPKETDSLSLFYGRTPFNRASPWLYLSEPYSNGQRAILGSNSTHAFKARYSENGIELIDSLRIDYDTFDYSWNFLLSNDKIWYSYDNFRGTGRIFRITDEDIDTIESPLVELDEFDLSVNGGGRLTSMHMTSDGWIVYNTREGLFGIVKKDFSQWTSIQLPLEPGEIHYHNTFPIDEDNSVYLVTTKKLIKIGWDGSQLSIIWTADYDFVNDGPTGLIAEGSGTTPTLVGFGDNDKLVVVCDGHNRNNMVAFWRDEIPQDWQGIAGEHPRLAGKIQLPYAVNLNNGFQSIENSPTAFGYDIACAQYNGFSPDCSNQKGVQKVSWDTDLNLFSIAWATNEVNFNGVLTYSSASGLVYGSGRETDCNYYFYALDWDTGEIKIRYAMGNSEKFNDQGNNVLIDEMGNALFCTETGMVLIRAQATTGDGQNQEEEPEIVEDLNGEGIITLTDGNVLGSQVEIIINNFEETKEYTLELFDMNGRQIASKTQQQELEAWNLEWISSGIYALKTSVNGENTEVEIQKVIKE